MPTTTARRVLAGSLLAMPATLALSGIASADIPELPDSVKNAVRPHLPQAPVLPAPVEPVLAALPVNVLRRDDAPIATNTSEPVQVTTSAPPAPKKITVAQLQEAATTTAMTKSVTSLIPTQEDVAKVFKGDFTPFGRHNATVAEGIEGLTQWQNSMIAAPAVTLAATLAEAGGMQAIVTNPREALKRAATSIAGPDFARDLDKVGMDVIVPTITKDWPLAALAGVTTLLGAPLLSALAGAVTGGSLSGLLGSSLGLAAAATLTYGAWLAAGIPASLVIGAVIGVVLAVVILGIGLIMTPFMLFSPLPFLFSFGAAGIALLFVPLLAIAIFVGLTWWMPTLAFMILAPLMMLGGGLLGSIPGALMGGSLGWLAGLLAAIPLAALVTALVGNYLGQERLRNNPEAADALGRLNESWGRAADNTELGKLIAQIRDAFWNSPIGQAIKPFVDAWAALWAGIDMNKIIAGATAGGLQGIWDGLRTGFPQGALTGALLGLPLMLLTLAASLVPPIAIGIMAAVGATALAAIPVLAIAVPLWLISVPITITGFLINGLGTLLILSVIGAPLGMFLFGVGWGIAGFGAGYASVIATMTALVLGAIFLANLGIVGIPTFLVTLPLFTFPAVGISGLFYLGTILGSGALAALVGATYGAGSGGIKGALAALPFALDWGGAIKAGLSPQAAPPAPAAPAAPAANGPVALPAVASPALAPWNSSRSVTDVTSLLPV